MHSTLSSLDGSRKAGARGRSFLVSLLAAGAICWTSTGLDAAPEHILLGPSDGYALDQPRVSFEVFDNGLSLGPTLTNTLLLDTGAERILVVSIAAEELLDNGLVTEGTVSEQGIGGDFEYDITAPYLLYYRDTDTLWSLDGARMLVNANNNFGGFDGILGMPGMVGKVLTMDFSVWAEFGLYMGVTLGPDLPPGDGHRYSVEIWPAEFSFPTPGDPIYPTTSPIPFLKGIASHGGTKFEGDFVLDTGAQVTFISLEVALALGLDQNGNGSVEDEAVDFVPIVGAAGEVLVPILLIDEFILPTEEQVDLVWNDVYVLVLDVHPDIDGVLGMDLLTSGWFNALFEYGWNGYIQQIRLDFRGFPTMRGKMYFDLTADYDTVSTLDPADSDSDGIPDEWEIEWFGAVMPASFDGDGDGATILEEFATRGSVLRNDGNALDVRFEGGTLFVSYLRNIDAAAVTVVLQESAGLSSWAPVLASPVVETINSVTERVTYELDPDTSGPFFRLSIAGGAPVSSSVSVARKRGGRSPAIRIPTGRARD